MEPALILFGKAQHSNRFSRVRGALGASREAYRLRERLYFTVRAAGIQNPGGLVNSSR